MEQNKSDKVLIFDTLYTTNHIQMLKIFLSFLEEPMQKNLAVFIKYLELQYTISFFQRKETEINICGGKHQPLNPDECLDELKSYCNEDEKSKIDQIFGIMNTMKMMQELQPLMEMMNSASQSEDGGTSDNNSDMMSQMLKNMLSPEQQTMFEMFTQI